MQARDSEGATTATGGRGRLRWRQSLQWRLPLLISAVFLAAFVAVVLAAFREVEATLERGAGERALQAARQVANILSGSAAQTYTQVVAVAATLGPLLDTPTEEHLAAARAALSTLGPSPRRRVTLWSASGAVLLELPPPANGERGQPARVPPPGIGPIRAEGDEAFADTAVAVPGPDGRRAATRGTLSVRSQLAISPPDALTRLIGGEARILFGNATGGAWTDMTRVQPGPPVDLSASTWQRYDDATGASRIGGTSALAGTPWLVWVEFPRGPMVASAWNFLGAMGLFVVAVAVGAVMVARRLVTDVTTPLAAMTTAAEAMAAGDSSRQVDTSRDDELGRLGRAFNAMRDAVTRELNERRRAIELLTEHEAAVRASEGRYRTLFDYAPDGILIADTDGRYVDANPAICAMLGHPRETIIGFHAADVVAPEEASQIAPALTVITNQAHHHRDWKFRRRDGTTFDADVFATQMPDGHVLAMVRDITARNAATEAVRIAEERMRFALESAGVGIWDTDYTTGVTRWSAILESQVGVAPGTLPPVFDALLEHVHADDRKLVRLALANATSRGTDFSIEYRLVRPDGTVRWMSGAGQVRLAPDGQPVRGVGISMDVTSRQVLEAQFQQAQKMEAVGRLAGGVAHDFNNLLTAILGHCELLLDDLRPDDPVREDIGEIQKAGTRAAELTRQLLAFSRKQIIEPTTIDMNEVVRGLESMLSRLIGEDIQVVVSLDEGPLLLIADRGQIEQLIVNLAVNARDAMPRGGTLTIDTAIVELDELYASTHFNVKPGNYVALTVSDTGMGMTADVQAHLFEPFFTTKEQGKGTGLGLATVHGVVTRAGGSVGVYSEVGRGTSFKVYFPRRAVAVSTAAPRRATKPLRGDGRTVLVVDDAEGLRTLMQRTLQRQGYKVIVASGAAEAVPAFDANPAIDVLLTDVVMPGASGPELTADLLARRPGLKVIYMSGYTEDAIVHHGVLQPGIAFLHKPFTADALNQKIREVLAG